MKTTPSLRERLRIYGITPRKSLGQNFLTDTTLAQRIVTLSGVTAQDVAIEIGPGAGALTHYLALAARHVIAEKEAAAASAAATTPIVQSQAE